MRTYTYHVDFGDDVMVVTANAAREATILAQAERIKLGLHYQVKSIIVEN